MITQEQLDKLEEFMFPEMSDYTLKDVMVDGKTKTAILFENQWYIFVVNFKFGDETHPGQPYLSGDRNTIEIVSEDYLNCLPEWTYDWKTGKFAVTNDDDNDYGQYIDPRHGR